MEHFAFVIGPEKLSFNGFKLWIKELKTIKDTILKGLAHILTSNVHPHLQRAFFNVTVSQDVQMLPMFIKKNFIREKELSPSSLSKHQQEIKM